MVSDGDTDEESAMNRLSRRSLLKAAVPTAIAALVLPAWLRNGDYQLPDIVSAAGGQLTPGPLPQGPERINPNILVGSLDAIHGKALMIRDGEGLHVATTDEHTLIIRAVSSPRHQQQQDHDVSRLRLADALWISGERKSDGNLLARNLTANVQINRGGIAQTVRTVNGDSVVDTKMYDSSWMTRGGAWDKYTTPLWIDPSASIQKLNREGVFVPARLTDLNPGQYIGCQTLTADDGSVVVVNLLLGNGNPPGKP